MSLLDDIKNMSIPPQPSSNNKTSTALFGNSSLALPDSTTQSAPVFSTTNLQSDGKNTLKRMEFEWKNESYKFETNPEEYTQSEPNRVTVTQTKAGAWVDDFGGGLVTINLKGTTGFKTGGGFTKFKELRDLIRSYYFKQDPGTEVSSDEEMTFHNYTDGEHWIVVPKTFDLYRSVNRPLVYAYSIQLLCLRPADQPSTLQTGGYNITANLSKVGVKG